MELFPGLPYDVGLECLLRIPFDQFPRALYVCNHWKFEINRPEFLQLRKSTGLARPIVIMAQADVQSTTTGTKFQSVPVYRLKVCEPETGYWSELPPPPGFSDGLPVFCQFVGVGSSLVVMGGYDPESWEVLSSVFVYDFVSAKWRRGTDMPAGPRSFFACASDSDRTVYVAGGHDDEKNALKSVLAYDVVDDDWRTLSDMANERDECFGVFSDGKFHVISGYSTATQGRFVESAETFDVARRRWDDVDDNFLDVAACSKFCSSNGVDGKIYTCRDGNLTARDKNGSWKVISGLPSGLSYVAFLAEFQGKVLTMAASKSEEAERIYIMDSESGSWTSLWTPEEHSGHVQSCCFLTL